MKTTLSCNQVHNFTIHAIFQRQHVRWCVSAFSSCMLTGFFFFRTVDSADTSSSNKHIRFFSRSGHPSKHFSKLCSSDIELWCYLKQINWMGCLNTSMSCSTSILNAMSLFLVVAFLFPLNNNFSFFQFLFRLFQMFYCCNPLERISSFGKWMNEMF